MIEMIGIKKRDYKGIKPRLQKPAEFSKEEDSQKVIKSIDKHPVVTCNK